MSEFDKLLSEQKYSKLIENIARRYWNMSKRYPSNNLDDFQQAATIGLWKAFQKRDASRGESFIKFARNKIRWECADCLRALVKKNKIRTFSIEDCLFSKNIENQSFDDYLPDGDRRIELLNAYYIDGYTLQEISKKSGINRILIKKEIISALQDIKECLNERD